MARPIQQHYVTKAYLEGFLERGQTSLFVYTRGKATFFRSRPENIAKRRNYYSIKREDGSYDDRLEHKIQQHVEGPGLAVLRRLATGNRQLSWQERGYLAFLMAIQEMRVPWMREAMEAMFGQVVDHVNQVSLSIPGLLEGRLEELQQANPSAEAVTAEELRKNYLEGKFRIEVDPQTSLWMMGKMAPILTDFYAQMKWAVYSGAQFVTSDCPVHRYYDSKPEAPPPTGLVDPRLEIHFPLTRERLLVLRHDHVKVHKYAELQKKGRHREAERVRKRTPEIAYKQLSDTEVAAYNKHGVSMADRWVFSPTRNDWIPLAFAGECRNMRYQVKYHEGPGLIGISTVFPT